MNFNVSIINYFKIDLNVSISTFFRRRKRLRLHSRECHPSHPLVTDFTIQKELPDQPQFHAGEPVSNTGSLYHGSTISKAGNSNGTAHKSLTAVTALTRNGHTMTRCCGNLEAHFQRHYNNNNQGQVNSLPNHYIPEQAQAFPRLTEVRPRLSVPERTVMELSERPPQMRPPAVLQPNAFPHIIIGGKPFYLIPSSGDESSNHNDGSFESYSYPQHMPIYEEIDGNSSYCGGRLYEATSDMEYSSEQGEVGSVERLAHPLESSMHPPRSPRMFKSLFVGGDHHHHHQRPISSATSHSQNSSQQTNTSEVSSSSSSSTTSTSNPNLQQQQHYVVLDPEIDVSIEERKKLKQNSFLSLYENTLSKSSKSPKLNRSGIRLSDGVERCRSPQSIYSARLASKSSSLSQCSSPNRSVYYYSDTLRRDNCFKQDQVNRSSIQEGEESGNNPLTDDSIEIELDTSFAKPAAVNTVIVLDDPKVSDKKKGSATLV